MDLSTRSWLEVFGADAPHTLDLDGPPAEETDAGWDSDLTVAGSVLHPDDTDLPILSSLLDSRRGATTAPAVLPLDSLQSLPVAIRML